jgi:hypothetical protein
MTAQRWFCLAGILRKVLSGTVLWLLSYLESMNTSPESPQGSSGAGRWCWSESSHIPFVKCGLWKRKFISETSQYILKFKICKLKHLTPNVIRIYGITDLYIKVIHPPEHSMSNYCKILKLYRFFIILF